MKTQEEYKAYAKNLELKIRNFSSIQYFLNWMNNLDKEGRIYFAANLKSHNNTILEYVILLIYATLAFFMMLITLIGIQSCINMFLKPDNNSIPVIVIGTIISLVNAMSHLFFLFPKVFYPIVSYLSDMYILRFINNEICRSCSLIMVIVIVSIIMVMV